MALNRLDLFHWTMLEKTLTWAYTDQVNPDFRNKTLGSAHIGLWQLLRGGVELEWHGGRLIWGPGDWIFLPPGSVHQSFSEDAEICSIRFAVNSLSNECLFDLKHPIFFKPVTQAFQRSCRRLVRTVKHDFGSDPRELRQAECSFSQHIRLETHFLEFLKHLLLHAERQNIPFRPLQKLDLRVQRCIWEFKNKSLSVRLTEAELAHIAGLSVGHLNRLFQEYLGQTLGVWMNRARLAKAKHLLAASPSIKEIAFDLGFSSPQHFASWYRKNTGQTPSNWRKDKRYVP